jgi:hypothetical protein
MHSLHVTVAIQGEFADDAARQCHLDQVVQEISATPGLLHGYLTVPIDGVGHAYTFYDTEENARASAPPIGFEHPSGMAVIKDVELAPVAAVL